MTKSRLAVFAGVALLASSTAGAEPMIGAFTTPGLADVRIGSNFVDLQQSATELESGSGDLLFVSATGDFVMLGLTPGTIKDLTTASDSLGSTFLSDNFNESTAQPASEFALTTFAELNAEQILEQWQGYVQSSHSGLFTISESPEMPEPATLLLLGSGLLGATYLRRRQLKRVV